MVRQRLNGGRRKPAAANGAKFGAKFGTTFGVTFGRKVGRTDAFDPLGS